MSRLCSSRFELAARKLGWTRIAGLDEPGRCALFGPVVAAAVILNPKRRIVGLADAKQLVRHRRSPGGFAPAWSHTTAPVFVRSGARCRLLVRGGHPNCAAAGCNSALMECSPGCRGFKGNRKEFSD